MSTTAKLFVNGGSQAVRLPKDYRFEGDEVRVRRLGHGVLLEPMTPSSWPADYWAHMPVIEDADWSRPSDSPPRPIDLELDVP